VEQDVERFGLLSTDIGHALVAVPALKRMVVFDTGQSGGELALARTSRDPFAFRGAIERLARANGTFTIAAAAATDRAQEVRELQHGMLTYSLLAGLHAVQGGPLAERWIEPAGEDRVAHVLEWFGFASAQVPQLAKQYFGQPQEIQHSSIGSSFPVLPVPAATSALKVEAVVAPAAVPPRPPTSVVTGPGPSKLAVLAVGINRYAEASMNLRYAAGDARAMADLFRRRGAAVYGQVHVKEILDEEATRSGILTPLENVAERIQSEDTLVVYLAGHGRMVGQRYYFIPHEFRREADTLEDDIRRQAIPADVLGDAISKAAALRRVLIFDTCASGGALELNRQGRDPFAFRGAIGQLGERQGVFTIAAAAVGEEAQEIAVLEHGVLTYALLAGLRAVPPGGPLEGLSIQPTSADGRVDVLEWFSFAAGHSSRLTHRYLGRQQDVQTSGQGSSFALLGVD
jgi:uncharacterized caspase-like protein